MRRSMSARSVVLLVAGATVALGIRASVAAPTEHQGGQITRVKVVTETAASTITHAQTSFVDLPGASTTISVPDGSEAIFLARFSGESDCFGRLGAWCSLQLLVGAGQASPAVGTDYAFDTVDQEAGNNWEGHAVERVLGPLGAGSYTVRVRWAMHVTEDCPCLGVSKFRLDDWTLVVERIKT
jgi:hypothetical protein